MLDRDHDHLVQAAEQRHDGTRFTLLLGRLDQARHRERRSRQRSRQDIGLDPAVRADQQRELRAGQRVFAGQQFRDRG